MKMALSVNTDAKTTRVTGADPPLRVAIRLTVEGARGEPIVGAVDSALREANKAVARVLETRGY